MTGSSITGVSTSAFSASSMRVRRLSPKVFASSSISPTTSSSSALRSLSTFSRPFCSFCRSFSSCSILMCSSFASMRRRMSRMSSACRSVSLNALIRSAFGSSALRMILITLSTFSRTIIRPSRTWIRSSTLSSRCFVRRVTVAKRNSTHSASTSRRFLPVGRPSSPTITRLIGAFVSRLVLASSRLTNSFSSILEVRGSNTRRTGCARSDSSRIRSSIESTSCFSRVCSGVSDFLPVFGCGLVIASISSSTLRAEVPGGSSVHDHLPLAAREPLDRPARAHADRAAPRLVRLLHLGARRDDLAAAREIRALDVLHQPGDRQVAVADHRDRGLRHLVEVVRRNLGRHPDRDAGRAVEQQHRQARRQHRRLDSGCRRSSATKSTVP